jgi:hypothetical protein
MPAPTIDELRDFYDRLEKADWYYEMSDDQRVWRAGCAAFDKIVAETETSDEKKDLYNRWRAHMFSGDPWKTVRAPRPERP